MVYPYWIYQAFNLDWLSDDRCKTYFRFHMLIENLQIREGITCHSGAVFSELEAFCVVLKPFKTFCLSLQIR